MDQIKPHSTVKSIAKKHRLDVSFVQNQLNMGIKIEHEHTKDRDLATDIALQHLDEIPDYYTRLKKMEKSAIKSHKKFKDVFEENKMKDKDPCWRGYKMIGKKKKGKQKVPNCVPIKESTGVRYCPKCDKNETRNECKYGERYWDIFSQPIRLGNKYTPNTPHPGNMPEAADHEHAMARSELFTISSAVKRLRKKMKGEGNIEAWIQSKITKAADYLDSAADYVDSGEMKENVERTSKTKTFEQFVLEAKTAAWQRKEGKRESGGLNKAGVESYRKENPGSKLKTAVTKDPSKLKKGGKAWNRRKSFCSRMTGMKKKLTSAKTARDPNSRINKSLRSWNC